MDLSRAVNPLNAMLRVLFALVILAALTVDRWVLGGAVPRSLDLAVVAIAVLGIGWVCWPKLTPVVAIGASSLSLMATARGLGDGLIFDLFTEFVVLPALFGAVLSSVAPWRWPIAAFVAVAAESIALRAGPSPIRWVIALSMLVLLGAAATAVVYMRLRDDERRASVDLARQNERLELARELHDVVGHHVTGIVVLAQASRFAAAADTGSGLLDVETERTLAEIEAAGLATLTSVRRLVGLLRADASISAGATLADIEHLVDELRRTHPDTALVVDSSTRGEWVPPDLAATVLRLVQEATTNVRKHGEKAEPVIVELRHSGASIVLSIENGADERTEGFGYGLIGMRERVEAFGGTFTAGFDGPRRWVVRASVPLSDFDLDFDEP